MSKVSESKIFASKSSAPLLSSGNQTYLGPIIIHSQDTLTIRAIEEYFQAKCIARIRSDSHNFYIDFKPMVKNDKLRDFVSPDFVLTHNGEIISFTHQFYDV
jgi:hypothetical protein